MRTLVSFVLVLCLCASVARAESSAETEPVAKTAYRHHFSFGFLNHQTGSSVVSYARTLWASENHEVYAGVGSVLALNTLAVGWKVYVFESFVDAYLVTAAHFMAGMSEKSLVAPFFAVGVEKSLWGGFFINAGVNNTLRLYLEDGRSYRDAEVLVFPHAHLTYRWQ